MSRTAPLPDEIREIHSKTEKTEKYRRWRKERKAELPQWKRDLKKAIQSSAFTESVSFVRKHFSEKPIQTLDSRHLEKLVANPRRLKSSMERLIDDALPIETRFSDLMGTDSKFHIPGLGRGTVSEWLMLWDPSQYGIWNAKSRTGMVRLGIMPSFSRGLSWGERYGSILSALLELQAVIGATDLSEVDLFLHFMGKPEPDAERAWQSVFGAPMPHVPGESYPGAGWGRARDKDYLSESGYTRSTPAETKRVERLHNQLSNRVRKWLERGLHATDIRQEHARTDLRCVHRGESYLFELKVIGDLEGATSGHGEIRDALGQLLDYGFYPTGRAKFAHLVIVTDGKPKENDLRWVRELAPLAGDVELLWCPPSSRVPLTAGFTRSALSRSARLARGSRNSQDR